ncbi:MAG TPA: fimbrial protein FimV, partial [Gammaproteobacteria bacterium]|nr:fimbrial protein FimV [Gammaproteobacteria bacterium]
MRLKTMLLLVIAIIPATALAMGLGEIQLNSGLNEPFDARIELVSVTDEELETLDVTLASEQAFERYDLPRPFHLQGLQFEVVDTGDSAYVHVTSREPMREPFVTLLVEADWANGRLLREYTVLLDPPVFDQAAQPAATQPAAVTQPTPTVEQPAQPAPAPATQTYEQSYTTGTVVETPEPAAVPEEAGPYPAVEPYTAPDGTYGRIQRGETLSEIALQL